MRPLLACVAAALALPAAAAAKGPISARLCGPDECRPVEVGALFERSGTPASPPEPGPYYELRVEFARGLYYEPRSGLVAHAESFGAVSWSRLEFGDAADGLRPFPTPRPTAAWVGERRVAGDASGYLRLVTLTGPFVVPERLTDFVRIRLESAAPNPWTSQGLVYYPRDRVLLTRGSLYVRVPDRIAVALEAATPIRERTTIPWIAIGVALAGSAVVVALRTLGSWSASWRPSSSSTSSGRPSSPRGRTPRSSAAA